VSGSELMLITLILILMMVIVLSRIVSK